jgi:hypothetical protein
MDEKFSQHDRSRVRVFHRWRFCPLGPGKQNPTLRTAPEDASFDGIGPADRYCDFPFV